MDDFFHYGSKVVMIIPIVIVILSLLFKFNQDQKINSFVNISPSQSLSPPPNNKLKINLNEKWLCHYKTDDQEYKLLIDNRKVNLEATVSGQFKKYDLSSYAGIIENILNMDVNQIEAMTKSYLPKGVDLKSLIESCKRG